MSVGDRVWLGTRCFLFRVGSPVMVCVTGSGNELCMEGGGSPACHIKQFYAIIGTSCLHVTFSAFFPSVFYILSPSVKFQMPRAPSVY